MQQDLQSIEDEITYLESERFRIERRLSVLRMKRDVLTTPQTALGENKPFNLKRIGARKPL